MLARVGQGFLHHVQHLDLDIRRQGQAIATYIQLRRHSGLVFEFLQGLLQRLFDVIGVGSGAEMHQQFAHVVDALAHAFIEFIQNLVHLVGLRPLARAAQQLDLDLHERERLGDRVMQLARQQGTLLAHGRFAFQGFGAQAFERTRQVAGQRVEQLGLFGGQRHRRAEEQVDLAKQPVLQPDRHADQALEADPRTAAHRFGIMRQDRNHARAGIGAQVAAGAGAGQQAAFLLQHLFGKAVGRQHQVTLVGVIGPAHGHRIGLHHGAHLACKPLRQLVDGVGFGHERADLVERGQPGTLRFDTPRLGLHLGLQPFVQRLQRCGHSVEAAGHLAEFVLGLDLDPRGKVPRLHLLQALAQVGQRVDHVHVTGEQHHHRADDRQRHHHKLEQVEDGGEPRQLVFDGQNQRVDGLNKLVRGPHRIDRAHRGAGEPLPAPLRPDPVDHLEPGVDRFVPRHEQGPRRIP